MQGFCGWRDVVESKGTGVWTGDALSAAWWDEVGTVVVDNSAAGVTIMTEWEAAGE